MPENVTLHGVVSKTFHSSATFSAGLLKTGDGQWVKFRGPFCANEGDSVALVGQFIQDPKFGHQFHVERLSYDLPESRDGLIQYLARHKAFSGIGEATARKLVDHVQTAEALEAALAGNIAGLHAALKIPVAVLENLRDAWVNNDKENKVRTFLASYGLTDHQMDTLLQNFGESIVGILKHDPYQLMNLVDGYGFKRVDQIARAMGTAKDHPGRVDAAILYALNEETRDGNTWTGGANLLDLAGNLLALDTLDSKTIVQQRGEALLEAKRIIADVSAITTPWLHQAELFIRTTLAESSARTAPLLPMVGYHYELKAAQLEAYRMALRHCICVISGGAGTGKTFVVSRLTNAFMSMGFNIALCAPTGKAAKRIEEVLRQHKIDLQAKTIHRLLHYNGTQFQRPSLSEPYELENSGEEEIVMPPIDVVIVDEVSMVDAPLMYELLKRINPNKTRLILVGDHNQLPPVGPGNILRDVIHHKLAPAVVLNEVVRQAGALKANCTGILSGRVAPSAGAADGWLVIDGFKEPEQIQTYLRDLILTDIPDRLKFDPIREVQIITPQHKGMLGTQSINRVMQYLLHGEVEGRFVPGDKVIQTRNDYELGVMNGTIGYVSELTTKGCHINFEGEGIKTVEGEDLEHIQLAYALTAHKAQGSEFPCAVVLCHKSHFFADRNWLYTACTRAAKTCILVGDKWGIENAAKKNNVIERRTLLSKWAQESKTAGDAQE